MRLALVSGSGLLNNAAPAEKLLVLGKHGTAGWQHLMRVMSDTQHVLERCMPRTSLAARVRGKLEVKLSNNEFQHGNCVIDASAWCGNCIKEAMHCIDNLPADYYDDNESDMEEDDYKEAAACEFQKWKEYEDWQKDAENCWVSSDSNLFSPQWN